MIKKLRRRLALVYICIRLRLIIGHPVTFRWLYFAWNNLKRRGF